jgi:Zn-dependent protease
MTEPLNRWEDQPQDADDWKRRSGKMLRTTTSLLLYVVIYYLVFHDLRSIIYLIIVIGVHESGHALGMKWIGYTDIRLFFVPFFGAFVSGKHEKSTPFKKCLMILAGPIPGIIVGTAFLIAYDRMGIHWLYPLGLMFLLLNVFNLLPIKPLDGGQLLFTMMPHWSFPIQSIFTAFAIILLTVMAWSMKSVLMGSIALFLMARLLMQVRSAWKTRHEDDEDMLLQPSTVQQLFLTILWLLGLLSPLLVISLITNNSIFSF